MDLNKILKLDANKFFQSKGFRNAVLIIVALIVLLSAFKTGFIVGIKKADFSCRWSDNYHRNFGGPKGGFLGGINDRDFIDANGAFGQIIKIDGRTLVMKGRGAVEKIILVGDKTSIQSPRGQVKLTDLRVDDTIVAIGQPNQSGQLEAKLIRLLPGAPALPPAGPGFPPHQ